MKVFISYSSGSKKWAHSLAQALREEGISPWLDDEKLEPGQDWQSEMERAVKSSDAVVELFDARDAKNPGQRRKWAEILDVLCEGQKKPLIPILMHNAELPGFLHGGEWDSGMQAIRVKDPGREWDQAVRNVIEVMEGKKRLDEVSLGEAVTVSESARSEQRRRLDYIGRLADNMKSARKERAD